MRIKAHLIQKDFKLITSTYETNIQWEWVGGKIT